MPTSVVYEIVRFYYGARPPLVGVRLANHSTAGGHFTLIVNLAESLPSEWCGPMVSEVKQDVDKLLSFGSCPSGLLE